MKVDGIVVPGGMGGFLCPPTHPEHTACVETDLHRRKENLGSMSLSYAAKCDYLQDSTRERAKAILDGWQLTKPGLDTPAVQDWIHQVLGYFRTCYRNPEKVGDSQWDASYVVIDSNSNPMDKVDDHCGVHLIRQYYPEYTPKVEDFGKAYWGKKPCTD